LYAQVWGTFWEKTTKSKTGLLSIPIDYLVGAHSRSFSPSSTNQTGIEIVCPDFLPTTLILI
jgi:hypothetical protein